MDIVFGVLGGIALFVAATFLGGLIYLAAVWLNAHKKRRGPWGRYSDWINRTATRIENKTKSEGGS